MTATNPLLQPFSNKDQAVPFDKIQVEHYIPALDEAIKIAKENIQAMKAQTEAPNFTNTIVALEASTELSDTIAGIYSNLEVAHASPELQALAVEVYPKLTALSSDISLDEDIFKQVKAVYDNRANLQLDT